MDGDDMVWVVVVTAVVTVVIVLAVEAIFLCLVKTSNRHVTTMTSSSSYSCQNCTSNVTNLSDDKCSCCQIHQQLNSTRICDDVTVDTAVASGGDAATAIDNVDDVTQELDDVTATTLRDECGVLASCSRPCSFWTTVSSELHYENEDDRGVVVYTQRMKRRCSNQRRHSVDVSPTSFPHLPNAHHRSNTSRSCPIQTENRPTSGTTTATADKGKNTEADVVELDCAGNESQQVKDSQKQSRIRFATSVDCLCHHHHHHHCQQHQQQDAKSNRNSFKHLLRRSTERLRLSTDNKPRCHHTV